MVTKDHLKAVLAGDKKFLRMSEVRYINVATYDEISELRLYNKVIAQPGISLFFPDKYPKGR